MRFFLIIFLMLSFTALEAAHDSYYESPDSYNITEDPGLATFTVNNVNNRYEVRWYIKVNSGSFVHDSTDKSTFLDGDLDNTVRMEGRSMVIEGRVYHDNGTYKETHTWNVTVRRPNLVVTSVWTDPTTIEKGDTFIIRATVKNTGTANASAGVVANQEATFYVNGTKFGEGDDYDGLSPNETVNVRSITLTATDYGLLNIEVRADGNDEVYESNENDNRRSISRTVEEPPKPWASYQLPDDLASSTFDGDRHDSVDYRYYYARKGVMIASDYVLIPTADANLDSGRGSSIESQKNDYFIMGHRGGGTGAQPEACFRSEGFYIPWDSNSYDFAFDDDGEVRIVNPSIEHRYYLFRKLHLRPQSVKSIDNNLRLSQVSSSNPFTKPKLVLSIHGWNAHAYRNMHDSDTGRVANEARKWLAQRDMDDEWDAFVYDWSIDANTGGTFSPYPSTTYPLSKITNPDQSLPNSIDTWAIQNATEAAEAALLHGRYLGQLIANGGVEEVQLIAHSAGSWMARTAATYLRTNRPSIKVQVTLLDPFMPREGNADSLLGQVVMSQLDDYGIVYLENYYSIDTNTDILGSSSTSQRFDWDSPQVQWLIATSLDGSYDDHAGPVKLYADSIADSVERLASWTLTSFNPDNWLLYNSLFYKDWQNITDSFRHISFVFSGANINDVMIMRHQIGQESDDTILETRADGQSDDNGVDDPGDFDNPLPFSGVDRRHKQIFSFSRPELGDG